MSDELTPCSELILYQTEDDRTRIEVRLEGDTVWLSQKQMAELFQKDVRTVNEHLKNVFEEGELRPESVLRKFRITATDGKSYETQHYNLDAILSVGYRVKSQRGTQFRIWATQRLREYIVKGFVLDDERLKNPPGAGVPAHFDELLERIRDIRVSERQHTTHASEHRAVEDVRLSEEFGFPCKISSAAGIDLWESDGWWSRRHVRVWCCGCARRGISRLGRSLWRSTNRCS